MTANDDEDVVEERHLYLMLKVGPSRATVEMSLRHNFYIYKTLQKELS